jgi:short-subunit dehydrogenase
VLHVGGVLGFAAGVVSAVPFTLVAWGFWSARDQFEPRTLALRERYGEWALVTGASAGIGAEFARALAAEGLSLVLTARREPRLRSLADELEKKFNIATRVVALDLADPDGADRLADGISDLEIGILVNNAGVGYAGRFDKQDTDRLRSLVAVNCVAPTVLASRLLSGPTGMIERGRGAVIFTGSAAGHQPVPLHGVYAATKAFDLFLGEAMFVELCGKGVDVLVVEPGPVATEFQEAAGELSSADVLPAEVVKVALERLGLQGSVMTSWFAWLRANLATRIGSRPLVAHAARGFMLPRTPVDMQ